MCHLDHHPTISYKDNWTCDLGSDVAGSSKDNQRIQPKPNYQVQGDLLQNGVKKRWNVPSLIATLLIKRNMMESQTNMYGEARMWTRIHKTLCVDT